MFWSVWCFLFSMSYLLSEANLRVGSYYAHVAFSLSLSASRRSLPCQLRLACLCYLSPPFLFFLPCTLFSVLAVRAQGDMLHVVGYSRSSVFLAVDVLYVLLRVVAPCTRLSSLSRQCWIVTSYKGFSSAAEISSKRPEIGRSLLATGECNILKTLHHLGLFYLRRCFIGSVASLISVLKETCWSSMVRTPQFVRANVATNPVSGLSLPMVFSTLFHLTVVVK